MGQRTLLYKFLGTSRAELLAAAPQAEEVDIHRLSRAMRSH
jgi:hypothetical protein